MPTRRPFLGGNWKMHKDRSTASTLARAVAEGVWQLNAATRPDVAIFPSFVHLDAVGASLRAATADGCPVLLGAQDVSPDADGAHTGEVSVSMLQDLGVGVVLVGHSERRTHQAESDGLVSRKARAVLNAGLRCVFCVGETLAARESGQTNEVNARQLHSGLSGVCAASASQLLTVAYEPVWAIGTGVSATPADAQAAHAEVRSTLADLFGSDTALAIRIQYGGSMQPSSAPALLRQADIDGGLVGGASLDAANFLSICAAAAAERTPSA